MMSAVTTALRPIAPTDAPSTPSAQTARPQPAFSSQAARPSIPGARLVAASDIAVILSVAVGVFTGVTAASWPSLGDVLAFQFSVTEVVLATGVALLVAAVFEVSGLYEAALVRRQSQERRRALAATAAITVGIALVLGAGEGVADRAALLRFWVASFAAIAVTRAIRARVARSAAGCRRALVVGSGPHALRICRELSTDPSTCYQVLGFVDTSDAPRSPFVTRRTLGTLDSLESILVREHVDEVHVGLPVKSHYHHIQDTIGVCERIGVKVMYGADIFGTDLARPRFGAAGASPRVELQVVTEGAAVAVKRVLDLIGAVALLVALAPLMLVTALAVRLTSDGPVIFAQERYGLNRRRFRMLKFRTMVSNAEQLQAALESQNEAQGPVFKIARDPRITPIGRWLRRTSIDELPQLINVLRGDMSLIGPRPLPLRDVARFSHTSDMRRFSVRPGLTGLWQVSGRSGLGFDQWIRLDLHYIDHWSLLLDFRILARTIPAVIRGTGAA